MSVGLARTFGGARVTVEANPASGACAQLSRADEKQHRPRMRPHTNELRASARPPPIRRRSGLTGRRNEGSKRCFRWGAQRPSG